MEYVLSQCPLDDYAALVRGALLPAQPGQVVSEEPDGIAFSATALMVAYDTSTSRQRRQRSSDGLPWASGTSRLVKQEQRSLASSAWPRGRETTHMLKRHFRRALWLALLAVALLVLVSYRRERSQGARAPKAPDAIPDYIGPHADAYITLAQVTTEEQDTANDLDPRPVRRLPTGTPDERFMAYFPHSGFHNQRISLENALVAAHMLGRTLLVPPVWLGTAIPFISFDKMHDRLLQARKTGLEHCRDILSGKIMPQECLGGYWDYTVVAWDFLVDLEKMIQMQPLVDRWDMSYDWLQANLGVEKDKDIYFLKDERLYDYKLYDTANDTDFLGKFEKRLDIEELRQASAGYKLVHFGTLFGSPRLHITRPEFAAVRTLARQSMIFKNPVLDQIADIIRDRLGGPESYLSVHFRLGDGVFQQKAMENSEKLFNTLCRSKLGLDGLICEEMASSSQQKRGMNTRIRRDHRTTTSSVDAPVSNSTTRSLDSQSLTKRYAKHDPHKSLPPLPPILSRSQSPLHSSMTCRGELYTSEGLQLLNTPIYIATDSKMPMSDPALAVFFDTFPCIFTLNDFSASKATESNSQPIPHFSKLGKLRNEEDGVPLAQFFYPFLDAMVAAKGRDVVGTVGSTFSKFAADVLHPVYHGWPVVERA